MIRINIKKDRTETDIHHDMHFLRIKHVIGCLFLIPIILLFALNGMAHYVQGKTDHTVFENEFINDTKKIVKRNKGIKKSLSSFLPKGNYIVIDTAKNILYLKNGDKVLHQAIVSTGSGKFLIDPLNQERKWVFDTPRGELIVRSKIAGPVWVKPDWAFIEEGIDIPNNYHDRIEEGVLGNYALGIGNGYFIHGTLYTRLLGKSITHGCIRLGDDDLKTVYKATHIGTRVYIF